MNCLYILVAPSAVGKSALLHKLKHENVAEGRPFWQAINKYSTRDCRGTDEETGIEDDVINIDDKTEELKNARYDFNQIKKQDLSTVDAQIEHKSKSDILISKRFQYIEEYCKDTGEQKKGIVYHLNTNLYAFNFEEIIDCLKSNNGVIICSDFDTIRLLKSNPDFGEAVRVVYIASSMDEQVLLKRYKDRVGNEEQNFSISKDKLNLIEGYINLILSAARIGHYEKIEQTVPLLNETWNSMLKYYATICNRKEKIRLLFNQYIENIAVIDHVILNFYDLDYMYEQMRQVIIHNNEIKTKVVKKRYPIFMVCAAPSSGKGTLMEIVSDIGKVDGSLVQIKKYAKREANPLTDRRDGMEPIGVDGKFERHIQEEFIWKWTGHKKSNHAQVSTEKEYAVDLNEIQKNIKEKKCQIFISNFDEIEKARVLFPDNIVVLYLHATHDTETRKHIERKRQLESRKSIQKNQLYGNELSDSELTKLFHEKQNYELYKKRVAADLEEIKDTHYKYIKHISQVDHVLLNTGTQDDLILQMLKILKNYTS